MLVAGDECRRTQKGNNNAYCQDNTLSWFDWSLVDEHAELVRFVRQLISFRLGNPTLRRRNFLRGGSSAAGVLPDVEWFSPEGSHVDWYAADASLVCFFGAPDQQRLLIEDDPSAGGTEGKPQHVLLFSHAGSEPRTFQFPVPEAVRSLPWRSFIDTAAAPPNDIASCPGKLIDVTQPLDLTDHSLLCLVADARPAVRRRIGQSRP
jgi:isoamylase